MTAVIREATPDDYEAWLAVFESVAAEGRWIGAELPFDLDHMRARFDAAMADDDATAFLAEIPGAGVVGNLGIRKLGYGVAEFGMSVVEGHRGRGVGSGLLSAAIDWARAKGAHKVSLQMWTHNEPARRLYEKFGFELEGHLRRHYPRKNGEIWDAYIMGLLLD